MHTYVQSGTADEIPFWGVRGEFETLAMQLGRLERGSLGGVSPVRA